MATLSPWEQGGVPCPGTNIPVLGDDSLSHAEEKKRSDAKDNRKAFRTLCASRTPAESCRRGGSEPQAAWRVLRKLHGCTNLTPKQGSIFGLRSAFLPPVGTREVHKRLEQHRPERRHRRRAWERSGAFLLSQQD